VKSTVRRPCRAQAPEGAQSILHVVVWLQPLQPLQLAACSAADRDKSSRWVDQAHYSDQSTATATATAMLHRTRYPVWNVKGRSSKGGKRHKGSQKQTTQTQTKTKTRTRTFIRARAPANARARRCSAAPHVCTPEQTRIAAYTRNGGGTVNTPLQAGRPLFTANRAHSPLMWHGSALDSILRYSAANMVECGEITWRWAGVVVRPLRLAQRLGLGAGLRLTRARL
jgi:hypothetical protein